MSKIKDFMKGQISVSVAVISAFGVIFASMVGAWTSAGARVNALETKVQVVEERESNHFEEVQKSLERIEVKIDKLK